ncbi:hypothetical protein DH2020_012236 [Rehmannia glutinosa]|uniref:Phosphate transporter PHO1-like protein n=1 Tax=Rehmannia glutinosa TaxID=99300 RepID=A0ABR0WYU2_REHGL
MVQEWQGAYMDYNHLKKILKDIIKFRQQTLSGFLKRKLTMYRAFSGLTGQPNNIRSSPKKNEDEVILVSPIQEEGSHNFYQTMILRPSEEGGELELLFFRKLDNEFNKVVIFYEAKVEEVKLRAEELNKQMDALIALRIKVDKPFVEQKVGPATTVISPVYGENQGGVHMDLIQEVEMSNESTCGDEQIRAEKNKKDAKGFKPASVEILDYVKINVHPDTPVSTLRNVIMSSKSVPSFSEDELRKAEEKLQRAFIEFYYQLGFLKSYCFLNMLAFSKIMKKYDKITSRNASKSYLEIVDKSYLGSSDEVNKLIERVEDTFIKHFTNGNRRKGMKSLRPRDKKERHSTTFFLGLFTGCTIALVAGIGVSIHARNLLNHEGREQYMNNIFPLYSLFVYIFLHMLMYGANTYFWRQFRVNYPFIFGFKPGTEMGFREIFLLASGLSVLAFAAVLSNLDMEMDPNTQSCASYNLLSFEHYISFKSFLSHSMCMAMHLGSPLQGIYANYVTFSDFFLADQFRLSEVYNFTSAIMDGVTSQGDQTVVALVMRTIYDLRRQMFWRIMAASTSGITTIYNTYWDIVIDWGLLRKNAKNPWLRDNLLISNKAVYFVAIVSNKSSFLFYVKLILDFNEAPFLHRKSMVALVASLEILRRGIWNFFRLENEHFNNVGKYRAFKSVPLPFYYQDEKD